MESNSRIETEKIQTSLKHLVLPEGKEVLKKIKNKNKRWGHIKRTQEPI